MSIRDEGPRASPYLIDRIPGSRLDLRVDSLTLETMWTRSPYRGTSDLYIADMARVNEVRRSFGSANVPSTEAVDVFVAMIAMVYEYVYFGQLVADVVIFHVSL